ncbi:MAG: hypothetical protein ACOC95_09120 [Planctomycetota bacterium]
MVDESQELRRVSWTELFSFTHIFKTWRMARHYSKLVLAFAAIALICLVGVVMDALWSWGGATARIGDVVAYHTAPNSAVYARQTAEAQQEADDALVGWMSRMPRHAWTLKPVLDTYSNEGGSTGAFRTQLEEAITAWQGKNPDAEPAPADRTALARQVAESRRDVWGRYREQVASMLRIAKRLVDAADDQAENQIEALPKEDRKAAEAQLSRDVHAAERALWKLRVALIEQRREALFGRGVFEVLAEYEQHCIANAFDAVGQGRIFSGAGRVLLDRQSRGVFEDDEPPPVVVEPSPAAEDVPADGEAITGDADVDVADRPPVAAVGPDEAAATAEALQDVEVEPMAAPTPYAPTTAQAEPVGLVGWLILMLAGLVWLAGAHWLYAIVFGVLSLSIWALFGGATARIAALHAAQEVTIPMGEALMFSANKFFSFVTAPLLLLAIIFGLGILLGLGGLLSAIPFAGAVLRIIFALLFGLILIVGGAITFVTIGLLAGFPLMYPAIAVEGSDSFDAISRSFSYVFGRPWRYALYFLVSAVYGTICYVFVRLFAYGTLLATHVFVSQGFFGLGLNTQEAPELAESAGLMDLLWGRPTFGNLSGTFHLAALDGWWNLATAWILRAWVFVVVGLVAAFVLSFAVSAFTNIYFLLRRKVDATDLDDVYVEDVPEDYGTFETEPAESETSEDQTSTEDTPAEDGEDDEAGQERPQE